VISCSLRMTTVLEPSSRRYSRIRAIVLPGHPMGGKPPRLILLNLVMPGMNGWDFRKEMKKVPMLAQIPVVVLSGVRNLDKKAATLGATGSFTKPYNLKALIDTVQRYCQPSVVDSDNGCERTMAT
jgi:CheY-like chemotaxis protein